MREKLINIFNKIINLKNKIAFFPTIIAIAGCAFAYIMMYLESNGISKYLLDFLPELVINNVETARTILTTFIAGLTSIMVFSFSMVMILLNQASSNFSPRLLPGLISNRKHQIVLGIYLFTIIYCIFILVFIEPSDKSYQIPGFSVLLSIFFMISSLAAFIYFIHSISQEIQINNILLRIYKSAEEKLKNKLTKEYKKEIDTSNWFAHKTKKTGYFQLISKETLISLTKKHQFKIEINLNEGSYCTVDSILFKTDIEVNNEISEKIYANFNFSKGELINNNYVLAFKQITEVAVKSMSPGINDPGTVINAIDYLSELFFLRVQIQDFDFKSDDENLLVIINSINFKNLLFNIMVALRTYCSHDFIIVSKLLLFLKNLKSKSNFDDYNEAIDKEISYLLTDAKTKIINKEDIKKLKKMI